MFGKKNRFIQEFREMLRSQNISFGSGLEFNKLPDTVQEELPSVLMHCYKNGGNKHDVMVWLSTKMADYLISKRDDKYDDTGSNYEMVRGSVSSWLERAIFSKKYAKMSDFSDFWLSAIVVATDGIPSCEALFGKLSSK
jgi:hypothetical protein